MNVGYVRVSTEEQNTARQEVLMEELGAERLYIEKISGKSTQDRAQLAQMLEFVRVGDCVVVESISRLARNTRDLLDIVARLKEKGVAFRSVKESIDTNTPAGEFMLTIFAAISQLERQYLLDRQREGIAIAKAAGKYKGRKRIELDDFEFRAIYARWKEGDITGVRAQELLKISKGTFYRRVREFEARSSSNQMDGSGVIKELLESLRTD